MVSFKIGVLAIQGAFSEHVTILEELLLLLSLQAKENLNGVEVIEVRKKEHLDQDVRGLIIPGRRTKIKKIG